MQILPRNWLWCDFYDTFVMLRDDHADLPINLLLFSGANATLLGEREPAWMRAGVELWKCHPVNDFVIHGGGACFGLELTIPCHRTLQPGATYQLSWQMAAAPDIVTINDAVVWRRSGDKTDHLVECLWRADGPKAVLRLLATSSEHEIRFTEHEGSLREVIDPPEIPALPGFTMPATIARFPVRPIYKQWLSRTTHPCPWPAPVPTVPWPTDALAIVIDLNGLNEFMPREQLPNLKYIMRCHEFGKVGINGIFYETVGWPPRMHSVYGRFPNLPVEDDITVTDMDRFMAANHIEHVYLETCQVGEWCKGDYFAFPGTYDPRMKLYQGMDVAVTLQQRYAKVKVYFWDPEMRLVGAINDPRNRVACDNPKDAELWNADGSDNLYDYWTKHENIYAAARAWHGKLAACLPDRSRVFSVMQSHGPWDLPMMAKVRPDVLDAKGIHRQPVQAFVAAGRGSARHAGLKLQYEIDTFVWNGYNCFAPYEMEQMYRLFYAAGGNAIYTQGDLFAITPEKNVAPNELGEAVLRAVRWIRTHPRRGEQVVPFAVLAGDALTPSFGPATVGDLWFTPRQKPRRPEHEDFELVTCFIPHMGHWFRGDHRETFTDVPYGPVDIAALADAADRLNEYRLVVMIGYHAMTVAQYAQIRLFVAGGGTFVCAWGHLKVRGEKDWHRTGRVLAADPRDVFGVSVGPDGLPQLADAEIVATHADGRPLVTRLGGAYLIWSELCQDVDDLEMGSTVRGVVSDLVRQLRTVEFARPGRYEALLARRDGLLDVFLFNHDRLRQPCGLGDEGTIYRGPVRLHLASVGQASVGLRVVRLDDDMRLHDATFRCVDGWLEIDAEIDRSSEYVVGPAADFERRLFS